MLDLEFNKTVENKLKNNVDLVKILIKLNKEPLEAVEELRELNEDKSSFSNYEALLASSERSIAISNLLNIITEQIKANNEVLLDMVDNDLKSVKDDMKERFKVQKTSSIAKQLDGLHVKLNDSSTTSLLENMYKLDKLKIDTIKAWINHNKDNIDNILEYDIESFIQELSTITEAYVEQSLEVIEIGDELVIDFKDEENESFQLPYVPVGEKVDTSETIKYLVENNIGTEPRLEIIVNLLNSNITKFKPSKSSLTKVIKVSQQALEDYNQNKISSEALDELTKKYNNVVKTYFNIFNLRLSTFSNYIDALEDIVENHNRVITDITYLQNSFK